MVDSLVCPGCGSQDIEQVKHAGYWVCDNCYEHGNKEKFKNKDQRSIIKIKGPAI